MTTQADDSSTITVIQFLVHKISFGITAMSKACFQITAFSDKDNDLKSEIFVFDADEHWGSKYQCKTTVEPRLNGEPRTLVSITISSHAIYSALKEMQLYKLDMGDLTFTFGFDQYPDPQFERGASVEAAQMETSVFIR